MTESVRYEYAHVRLSGGVDFACTDAAFFDRMVAEVRRMVPGCKATVAQDLSGERASVALDNLKNREGAVAQWMIKALCHQGWEPFWGSVAYYGGGELAFRKRV
jgi:hypothetical protein